MPYISKELREILESGDPHSSGELNYCITKMICKYLEGAGKSYSSYNEVVGVLECAKLEAYRKMIAPYEDKKCVENGEVY